MSIYISGVKMPKKDGVVDLRILGNVNVEIVDGYHSFWHSGAKAFEVPPHGRLIDADDVDTITVICNERGFLKAIDAPIIIPASEVKNDVE